MPSCERIPPQDFHNRESRLYTEHCVRQLMESKSYNDYVSHLEYSERLYMTWLIVPIGLTIAVYFHMFSMLGGGGVWIEPLASEEGSVNNSLLTSGANALLLFFLAPSVVVAPFVGFYESITRRQAFGLVVLFTSINLGLVSFGGKWLHHPPFLMTNPPLNWTETNVTESRQVATAALTRMLPLEGAVVAGWLVFEWHELRWRSAWHLPLPVFLVPFFVSAFACGWFYVTSYALSVLFPADGTEGLGAAAALTAVWEVVHKDVARALKSPSAPSVLTDPVKKHHAWWTAMIVSFSYFVAILFMPVIRVVLRLVYALLPTHPTTWSISVISCVSGICALFQYSGASAGHLLGLLVILFMLLQNGFVIG